MRLEMTDPETRERSPLRVTSGDWVLGLCLLLGACGLLAAPISAPFLIGGVRLLHGL